MKIDCVFIHGWAMNSAVWQPCLRQLPARINPLCVDLPGYGASAGVAPTTLDAYADHVARRIGRPALVAGWSLGGLVALQLARRYPRKVSWLLQIATSPKFVQANDWQTAIAASVFEQFAVSLQQDMPRTIRRFLALQVRGTDTSTRTVRQLQSALDERGLPGVADLAAGLKILAEADLRAALQDLPCPVTWLLGQKDALVPVELAAVLRQKLNGADIQIIPGAGHAPMVSHPDSVVQALLSAADGVE